MYTEDTLQEVIQKERERQATYNIKTLPHAILEKHIFSFFGKNTLKNAAAVNKQFNGIARKLLTTYTNKTGFEHVHNWALNVLNIETNQWSNFFIEVAKRINQGTLPRFQFSNLIHTISPKKRKDLGKALTGTDKLFELKSDSQDIKQLLFKNIRDLFGTPERANKHLCYVFDNVEHALPDNINL